jgi:DNA-binding GntR family transcriptional regulator
VAAGDGEAAANLMRAHLYRSLENALRIFDASPGDT